MASSTHDKRISALADTIRQAPTETIVPSEARLTRLRHEALAQLQAQRPLSDTAFPSHLEIERTLGEGGMGVVRLANQTALGRSVAVKSPRAEEPDEETLLRLMQEAWITGRLEHPNIVPVHDVAMDVQGRPHIVLKRIGGTEWSALLSSPEEVRERFGVTDVLEWHLQILTQLCNAVHFAHSLGIVHRDLKPDNVMIGEFGEVYLLDWGIAVSLEDDGTGRFPLASDATLMAGTPVYMAPEMLGGSDSGITPRTDVYLLGSVLYEVVCGSPPHTADTTLGVMVLVQRSNPTIQPDVPDELAELIRRAMARDPDDRLESADAFRLCIADFLRHRGASRLAEDAERRLAELESMVAEGGDRRELYNLYGACQFGFRSALDQWEDERAQRGWNRATEVMADFELESGDPRAAEALLDQLPERPKDLGVRVAQALKEHAEKQSVQAGLAAIGKGRDLTVGARTRVTLLVVLGLAWTFGPLVRAIVWDAGELRPLEAVANGGFVVFVALAALAAGFGRVIVSTEVNRSLLASLLVVAGGHMLYGFSMWLAGAEHISSVALFSVITTACGMVTVAIERRFWPATLAFAIAVLLAATWPNLRSYWVSAANAALILTVTTIWWPRRTAE